MFRATSFWIFRFAVSLCVLFFLALPAAQAGSATWSSAPASGNWNTAGNWTPAVIPNGPADTATFALSNTTAVSLSASVEVNSIAYSPGASPFTISVPSPQVLTLSGAGITNNSGVTQNFAVGVNGSLAGQISFTNSATSGSQTSFTTTGGNIFNYGGGRVYFFGNSSAAQSVFLNNGGTISGAYGGVTAFIDNATAGNAVITNLERANSAASGGGKTTFNSSANAGNATIINKPNGHPVGTNFGEPTLFVDKAKAGTSTIINEGATVNGQVGGGTSFIGSSSADSATIICEGGQVAGAAGGLLDFGESAKTGSGTLIANAGVNGGEGGKIVIDTRTGVGSPIVQLHGNGTLFAVGVPGPSRMVGAIEGDGIVSIGTGLSVGGSNLSFTFAGTIEGGGSLIKTGSGTFTFSGTATSSGGFTSVEGGTLIVTTAIGAGGYGVQVGDYTGLGVLAQGLTLTLIRNTSADPISGVFANLPDGGIVTIGGNNFQADYEGGDGNDLTLTIVS